MGPRFREMVSKTSHSKEYSGKQFLFFFSLNWKYDYQSYNRHTWSPSEVKVAQSCPPLQPPGLYSPWNSPGQSTGVCSLSLLQGVFPTQRSNPQASHIAGRFFTSWATREAQESSTNQQGIINYFASSYYGGQKNRPPKCQGSNPWICKHYITKEN